MERMTTTEPAHGQPRTPQRAVHLHSFQGICAARRIEPAPLTQQRADEPLVTPQQDHQHRGSGGPRPSFLASSGAHPHVTPHCRLSKAPITRPTSAARSAWCAPAARGAARNTSRLPPGSAPRYPRTKCLSRRRTLFRTTADPTALLTTNPTSGGPRSSERTSRCPETSGRPARLLPARVAAAKSALRRILATAGSISTPAPIRSGAEARAPLAASSREDGTARPGAHAQAEAMSLGPAAVVRLKSTLAH